MLITMLTAGTRGDVQPYIALGVALQKAGDYTIRIAASENFESLVKEFGLEFYPLPGDLSKIAEDSRIRKAMEADNPLKIIMSFNRLKSPIFDFQKDFYRACQGSDGIIYHPGAAIAYFIAQRLNIPSILASPFPMQPTQDYPALIFYHFPRLGKGFNRLTHLVFEEIMWGMSKSGIKAFWQKEFRTNPPNFANPFRKQQPTIVSCSNYVFPKPQDLPVTVHNTGYWFLDEGVNGLLKEELEDFLSSGSPPVYVGFGSLGDPTQAEKTTQLVINALNLCGQRGILVTGWHGMAKLDRMPETILMLESVSHAWLFPRLSVIVHHGGAGTTAAALRSGVPSVIIPHANDQFAWGTRLYELGVAAKPIPRKKLTANNLAAAITDTFRQEVRQKAKVLGEKIQGEKGLEKAVQIVMDCFKQGST
ncbi:Sterol 3-beta-glucosyltransferase [Rippkaea orientalis PCC 8801]|uniref:Sterol 3-beta-glucosyltransferase n=1 Tax=Rippkaea orientalis (strain PCC 8801 / RF-1) TaxID=41431 RepID=B7JXL8_RIPO1|nr:glycosyltransferase [Rippkaea orientalis]ACK64775.1 Sterol 3-beta-glucosyltransferase [Rippkaea orientalis PCC 8801]